MKKKSYCSGPSVVSSAANSTATPNVSALTAATSPQSASRPGVARA
ncbi:MAG TPA: hypothetical protein VL738_17760 [Dactylosporangium sp.]|nr:hypothetical protein [Dactylosporangium sp.]